MVIDGCLGEGCLCLGYGTKGSVGIVGGVVLSWGKVVSLLVGVVVEFYRDSAAWSKVRYGKGHKTERIVVGTILRCKCSGLFYGSSSEGRSFRNNQGYIGSSVRTSWNRQTGDIALCRVRRTIVVTVSISWSSVFDAVRDSVGVGVESTFFKVTTARDGAGVRCDVVVRKT